MFVPGKRILNLRKNKGKIQKFKKKSRNQSYIGEAIAFSFPIEGQVEDETVLANKFH